MRKSKHARCWPFAALILTLLLAGGCGGEPAETAAGTGGTATEQSEDEAKEAFTATFRSLFETEDMEERFKRVSDLLDRFPDTQYSANAIGYLADQYYVRHLDDLDAAIAFVQERIKPFTGSRVIEGQKTLIRLYGKKGDLEKVNELVDSIETAGNMDFSVHFTVAGIAYSAEKWDAVIKHARAAAEQATLEAVRASLDDQDADDSYVNNYFKYLKSSALTKLAQAYKETGNLDAALESFSAADEFVMYNYLGIATGNFSYQWARGLIEKGDYQAAMRRIAPEAVMRGTEEALDIYKEAFLKSGGDEADLDASLENIRSEVARPVPEFEAYTYEGTKAAWSNLKGRVTFLSFWFPT